MSVLARLLLVLLVVDAMVLAVIELFYLPLRLGPRYHGVMLPVSVLLAAVTTPLLVRAAGRLTPRLPLAGAPLAAWVLTVLVFGVAGPGGDVMLPADVRSLLLLVAGVLPSGVLLGRLAAGGRATAAAGGAPTGAAAAGAAATAAGGAPAGAAATPTAATTAGAARTAAAPVTAARGLEDSDGT